MAVKYHYQEYPPSAVEEFRSQILDRCHDDARLVNLFGHLEASGKVRLLAILGLDEEAGLEILSTLISPESPQYESLTKDLPQAHLFEREIAEQWAIQPVGHPWLKPLRYHSNYRARSGYLEGYCQQDDPRGISFLCGWRRRSP